MNNLVRSGQSPEEARESISGMISNTFSRHEAGEGTLGSILAQESKKLNQMDSGGSTNDGGIA